MRTFILCAGIILAVVSAFISGYHFNKLKLIYKQMKFIHWGGFLNIKHGSIWYKNTILWEW